MRPVSFGSWEDTNHISLEWGRAQITQVQLAFWFCAVHAGHSRTKIRPSTPASSTPTSSEIPSSQALFARFPQILHLTGTVALALDVTNTAYSKMEPLPAQTPNDPCNSCASTSINYKLIISVLWNNHSLLLLRARTTHQCMKSLHTGTYFIWSVNEEWHSNLQCHALLFINTTIPKQLWGEKSWVE